MRTTPTSLALISLAACATAVAPAELVAARAAYTRAEAGAANTYKPDELHEARLALARAEQAFTADGADDHSVTLAYLALRRTEMAEADGVTAQAMAEKQQDTAQLTQTATTELRQTRKDLNQTREELASEAEARDRSERLAREALNKLALVSVPVKEEPRGTVITLPGSVLFASGKSALLSSGTQKLAQVASVLKDQPEHEIAIEGYTDSRGSDDLNQALSERRAETVRNFLIAQGLPGDHINAVGLGASSPVADNTTAEGRADNRRVEIVVKEPSEPK
jgi:outer membrane protein OmpA-like peptidoglycan-associated protein